MFFMKKMVRYYIKTIMVNNFETCDNNTKYLVIKAINNISRIKWSSHPITNVELQNEVNDIIFLS